MTILPIAFPGSKYELQPFPGAPHPRISLAVEVSLPAPHLLRLWFVFAGEIEGVRFPEWGRAERTDGLWQHTCCEAFIRPDGEGYSEFNFTSSGNWAAYRFDGYRKGMADLDCSEPIVTTAGISGIFSVGADIDLRELPSVASRKLGLSAVIEETDGTKSYWALRHPPGKPDFHHPDCFALELPAPETP